MKKHLLLTALMMLILLPSCFHTREEPASLTPEAKPVVLRDFKPEDQVSALSIASGFAESFVKAVETGEFIHWKNRMSPETAKKIDEKKFAKMREELQQIFGDFQQASFMGELISGNLRSYLWKMRFTREKEGNTEVNETIYFVRVFCEEGKTPAISGFGVKVF